MAVALDRRKKLPNLGPFLRECFPPKPGSHEAMLAERTRWLAWAAANKLKVTKKKARRGGH